ncbi:hypothetical protein [Actinacidiphila sp. bgisy160]|uniref:hypothetical protein n=1 Tax=Actinacidiphila sp. bgisy160 TaxID=3413796 RepID=UPI003D710E94
MGETLTDLALAAENEQWEASGAAEAANRAAWPAYALGFAKRTLGEEAAAELTFTANALPSEDAEAEADAPVPGSPGLILRWAGGGSVEETLTLIAPCEACKVDRKVGGVVDLAQLGRMLLSERRR